MRNVVLPLVATLLAASCAEAPEAEQAPVEVEDARIVLPVLSDRPGAAYFIIRADRAGRLTGISSPGVGRIELHASTSHDGLMRMTPLPSVPITPGAPIVFAPGGRHAMLYDISPSLRPTEPATLTFRFEGLPEVTVPAEVHRIGGARQ